jgi:hypothetical protein
MWESRLSGSVRGWVTTQAMDEILWHRRETRRPTEEDKLHPTARGVPSLLETPLLREAGARGAGP